MDWILFSHNSIGWLYAHFNTLRQKQNGRHFLDDFSNAFSWKKIYEFQLRFNFFRSLCLRVQLLTFRHRLRQWLGAGDRPLSGPMLVSLPTHICITRLQWVNKRLLCILCVTTGISEPCTEPSAFSALIQIYRSRTSGLKRKCNIRQLISSLKSIYYAHRIQKPYPVLPLKLLNSYSRKKVNLSLYRYLVKYPLIVHPPDYERWCHTSLPQGLTVVLILIEKFEYLVILCIIMDYKVR